MSVGGSVIASLEMYPGIKDIARWKAGIRVAGDASGGSVTLTIILSKAVFPGLWAFTLEHLITWSTYVGGNLSCTFQLYTQDLCKDGLYLDKYVTFSCLQRPAGGGAIMDGTTCPSTWLDRFPYKPNQATDSPTMQMVYEANQNANFFYFTAAGHIYDINGIGLTRKLF